MEKERRKFKRFDAFLSVKYKSDDNVQKRGLSLSKDLSREGMKVTMNEMLKRGSLVDLEIDIPDDPKPIQTSAEVVWSKPAQEEDRAYETGLRFVMMDPVDKFRVLDYAYNHWLETKVNDYADPEQIPETA